MAVRLEGASELHRRMFDCSIRPLYHLNKDTEDLPCTKYALHQYIRINDESWFKRVDHVGEIRVKMLGFRKVSNLERERHMLGSHESRRGRLLAVPLASTASRRRTVAMVYEYSQWIGKRCCGERNNRERCAGKLKWWS